MERSSCSPLQPERYFFPQEMVLCDCFLMQIVVSLSQHQFV
jgi:hypothetical protein